MKLTCFYFDISAVYDSALAGSLAEVVGLMNGALKLFWRKRPKPEIEILFVTLGYIKLA
jgi:hypothetical protein